MRLFNKEKTLIKKPFSDKYKMIITSEINLGTMNIKTKALVRWLVNVKSISGDNLNLELITLENELLESNNPIVKEAANASQAFARMYSELDLVIDHAFKVLKIINIETIKDKWQILKNELDELKAEEPQGMLNQVIQTNEDILLQPQNTVDSIQYNEFFQFWAHHLYNTDMDTFTHNYPTKTLFNTAIIEWSYKYSKRESNNENLKHYELDVIANLETKVNKSWIKEAYKDFTYLNIESLNPQFVEKGGYTIDNETGKIINGTMTRKEIVHPELLNATINYDIKMEENIYFDKPENELQNKVISSQGRRPFSVLIDE
jgi:hypothetical protein